MVCADDACSAQLGVSFKCLDSSLLGHGGDWRALGGARLGDLPGVSRWPTLRVDQMVQAFFEMGVLESGPVHDALLRSSRGIILCNWSRGLNIETSALRMPWWEDVSLHQSLLRGCP